MIFSRWFVVVGLVLTGTLSLRAGQMQYEVAGTESVRPFDLNEHFRPSSAYHYLNIWDRTLLDPNGNLVNLPTGPDFRNIPMAWNKAGDIVGQSYFGGGQQVGFLYKNGEITYFEPREGMVAQGATAINNLDQVVGGGWPFFGNAYLYSGGIKTDLGGIGGSISIANDINDSGVIVGESLTGGSYVHGAKGFVIKDGIMSDLNQVTLGLGDWYIRNPLAVTSDGWIYATVNKSTPGTDDQIYIDNLWLKPVVSDTGSTPTDSSSTTTSTSTVIDTTSGGFWTTSTDTPSLNGPATNTGGGSVVSPQPAPVPEPATYLIWGSLAIFLIWKRLA